MCWDWTQYLPYVPSLSKNNSSIDLFLVDIKRYKFKMYEMCCMCYFFI